jgi:hypothetical protein
MLRRESPKQVALSSIASEPIGRGKPDRDGFVELSLFKISTGLREAGDFHEPAVP